MATVEIFFDYSSPWTYLAFSQLRSLQHRYPDASFVFRPVRRHATIAAAGWQIALPALLPGSTLHRFTARGTPAPAS